MGKLLEFKGSSSKRKSSAKNEKAKVNEGQITADLVDMTARREAEINAERRQVRRTILTEFIAVHAIVPEFGLMKVSLYNINGSGLAFDIDERRGAFKAGEEVPLRVYLNHQTYFPIVVKIRHITDVVDEGVIRHGCEFVKGEINDVALQHFVGFLEHISANLRQDRGDVLVTNINS